MKGSAPNSPTTGSHTSVRQKFSPNFRIDSIDSLVRVTPIAKTIATSRNPNRPVPSRNARSLRYFDLAKGRHLELDDGFGQRGVAQVGAVLLAVGQRPLHEVHHRLRLRLVLRVLVEEQPGEGRDRIDAFARRVGDRYAEVGRH